MSAFALVPSLPGMESTTALHSHEELRLTPAGAQYVGTSPSDDDRPVICLGENRFAFRVPTNEESRPGQGGSQEGEARGNGRTTC